MIRQTPPRLGALLLVGFTITGIGNLCGIGGAVARAERQAASGPATVEQHRASWQRHQELEQSSLFKGLEWRSVGPVVQGGRVVDIESVPGEPYTFYVAYASGGLWKTTNNGVTFEPLFDHQQTLIMGDLAVDPQAPQTLWVGTGESNSSRSSYGGRGIYRSTDGGQSWQHLGLEEVDRIGRVLVDPQDSRRVYVAALGKLYTSGGGRGVYRTVDGGQSWQQVLDTGELTGVVDLVIDPANHQVLYAATWERSRRPWDFVEGGAGSGIWKSVDGGSHWQRLDGGLPRGTHVGRIGLALAASRPQTLYAALDNQQPLPEEQWDLGDGAVTAKRLRQMTRVEFLDQDPEEIEDFIRASDLAIEIDAETLLDMVEAEEITLEDLLAELDDANASLFQTDIRGLEIWRSDDGGASWRLTHEQPIRQVAYTYGYYFGQIRVAPDDPQRLYVLGVPVITSADGGQTWSGLNGRGVHVDHHEFWIDPHYPQRMIVGNDGGLDLSYDGGVSWLKLDAQAVGQLYTVAVDLAEPYNIYGGLQDNGTLKGPSDYQLGISQPWRRVGGGDGMHVQVDPRDNQTTYLGFQFGFYQRLDPDGERATVRPRDGLGEPALRYNWNTPVRLSPHHADIVYYGAEKLYRSLDQGETWTAISPDLTRSQERGDVPYATLTTISESPLEFGRIWVGSDDGQIHLTTDGGQNWRDVGAQLPADRWVSRVEASNFDKDVAYLSLNGYRNDDVTPYLYRTADLGTTWQDLSAGLPAEAINVVCEDPVNPDVLYVGSDRGVYVSLDRGQIWQALQGALPNVPVHDLVVHPRQRELIAGTHGRSVWVVDVLPVQELTEELRAEPVHLFPVEAVDYQRGWKRRRSEWFYRAEDAPELKIPFWSAEAGVVELILLDEDGRELRRIEHPAERGVGTFIWNLLLDQELALAAESEKLAEQEAEKSDSKKKSRRAKKEAAAADPAKTERGKRAKTPWAELVRLQRQLYITPGSYQLELRRGEASHQIDFEVKPAEERPPRKKKEPAIRGRDEGDKKDALAKRG